MPGPRANPECHARGAQVYVFGGVSTFENETATTWVYDTQADTWTELSDAPTAHNHYFLANGDFYSAVPQEPGLMGAFSYHVPTDTWVQGTPGIAANPQGHARGPGIIQAFLA